MSGGGKPTHAVVKVRWPRGGCVTGLMPLDEAQAEADRIHDAVVACGEGWRFVEVTGWDGRKSRIRGREITAIEWVPGGPDRIVPPAAAERDGGRRSATGTVAGARLTMHPGGTVPVGGTAWLQQQAARQTPEQIADQVVRP